MTQSIYQCRAQNLIFEYLLPPAGALSLEQEVSTLAPQMITRVAASTQFVIFFIVFIIMCCFVLFVVINYMISFTRKPRLVGSSITCLH